MSLHRRVLALEARQVPVREPWVMSIMACHDGTSITVCYPLPRAENETMTLRDYHVRFGGTYRDRERWVLLDDSEPFKDRLCEHWPHRRTS